MMIGHLAVAGMAEGAIAAARGYPQTADRAFCGTSGSPRPMRLSPAGQKSLGKLWTTVALLMLLTLLGILASGTA